MRYYPEILGFFLAGVSLVDLACFHIVGYLDIALLNY